MSGVLEIRSLTEGEDAPYDLLLLADPSREIVEEILKRGHTFLGLSGGEIVGVYVLLDTRPFVVELMNIAVVEEKQGRGFGKRLLADSIKQARGLGARVMEVATGNSSLDQLALYQKAGFRIHSVERDFFSDYEQIIENGIRCLDLIRLKQDLS